MAFITLGTASQLVIKVPTIGSTDWGDTMRTDTFLKIAEHNHSGSGTGSQLGAGSLTDDAVNGSNIRLDNNEFLKARNFADTTNVDIVKIDVNDYCHIDTRVSKLSMKHNTFFTAEDSTGILDIDLFKLDTNNDLAIDPQISKLLLKNTIPLQSRNAADSGNVSILSVNASDKIALGADLANLAIINNTYLQSRNAADNGYIDLAKVNASDLIELGANVVAANVATLGTSLIDTLDTAVTLADNQAAVTAGIVTLGTDESCAVHYRIVRNGVTQSGVLRFTDAETVPSESYTGTDVGVTFTVNAGDLEYATTSTGSTGSMTYVVVKE